MPDLRQARRPRLPSLL